MSTIIDLTHVLHREIPSWSGNADFVIETTCDYSNCTPPDIFRIQKIHCGMSLGTHIDSPAHVVAGGRTTDTFSLEELIVPCIVIDVHSEATEQYCIKPDTIERFEKEHGMIPQKSFVIFHTGWSSRWNNPEAYRNNYAFPYLYEETADLLISRKIAGVGTDTLSVDTGKIGFPVHRKILGANMYLVENIARADKLPPIGATITIGVMKIKDATEAPVRIFASID